MLLASWRRMRVFRWPQKLLRWNPEPVVPVLIAARANTRRASDLAPEAQ
jgi:hypothetical protein